MIENIIYNGKKQILKLYDNEKALCGVYKGEMAVELYKKIVNYD